ncbi:MAG: amidohydrolase [Spirochaetae bacterium HGW-Spirochaetae-5]|nr:MAG: amidohydrolase [Spirochaetae bacterium HGW-Spirochaetae-5]
MKNLRVTLIQSAIEWHNIDSNILHFRSLISDIENKTDLIILPEMFTTGFTMNPVAIAEEMNGEAVSAIKEWSSTSGADITGSIIVKEDNRYYNRLIWVKPDGEIFTYDKRHLFRMAGEEKVYSPGNSHLTVNLHGWRIRPFICYDLRFPVWTRNTGTEYDLALFTANWPAARETHWDTLLRARAIENQCYIAGINRTGIDGNGVNYNGKSSMIDFYGNILFQADEKECIQTMELSYDELTGYRESFPAWMDSDRFQLI